MALVTESSSIFNLSPTAQMNALEYGKRAFNSYISLWNIRTNLEEIDRYYQREGNYGFDNMMSKAANRGGDKSKFRDFTVPIVMPQVEAALSYLTNVFATGSPMFAVDGNPEYQDAAKQIETIYAQHAKKAKWSMNLIKAMRDSLKYNLMGLYVDWEKIPTWDVVTDSKFDRERGKPSQTAWEGNVLRHLDLYNCFWDIRVKPSEVHTKGEFFGFTEILVRPVMKEFINSLYGQIPVATAEAALRSSYMQQEDSYLGQFYLPMINDSSILPRDNRNQFNWVMWAQGLNQKNRNMTANYSGIYAKTRLFARIIPSDFGIQVPQANHAQIWEFCYVNNNVLLYAKRLTNAHNMLPTILGQAIDDGLGYQTKSFANNVSDMQDLGSAMWNLNIAGKRKALMERLFYDPLRIKEADINSTNPVARIPVRPSAYGKDIASALHSQPYNDQGGDRMINEAGLVVRQADLTNGQNQAGQGQFVKGNKTRREYEDVMGHSNSRNQLIGLNIEHGVLTDVKEILLTNVLQNQTSAEMYSAKTKSTVKIDPVNLRKAVVEFKTTDGMVPAEKEMSSEEYAVAMQTMQAVPGIGAEYNVGDIFNYFMKTRGADLDPFRKSPALRMYEKQLESWRMAAQQAADAKAPFSSPQPEPSPELQAELQAAGQKKERTLMDVLQQTAPALPQ